MRTTMNITQARAKLCELVARAEAGEEVLIARNGDPVVWLDPVSSPNPGKRQPGVWAKYGAPENPELFLEPDVELEALMDEPIEPKP